MVPCGPSHFAPTNKEGRFVFEMFLLLRMRLEGLHVRFAVDVIQERLAPDRTVVLRPLHSRPGAR